MTGSDDGATDDRLHRALRQLGEAFARFDAVLRCPGDDAERTADHDLHPSLRPARRSPASRPAPAPDPDDNRRLP